MLLYLLTCASISVHVKTLRKRRWPAWIITVMTGTNAWIFSRCTETARSNGLVYISISVLSLGIYLTQVTLDGRAEGRSSRRSTHRITVQYALLAYIEAQYCTYKWQTCGLVSITNIKASSFAAIASDLTNNQDRILVVQVLYPQLSSSR